MHKLKNLLVIILSVAIVSQSTAFGSVQSPNEPSVIDAPQACNGGKCITLQMYVSTSKTCGNSDVIDVTAGTPVYFCYVARNTSIDLGITLGPNSLVSSVRGQILQDANFYLSPYQEYKYIDPTPSAFNTTTINEATWSARYSHYMIEASESATVRIYVASPTPMPTLTPTAIATSTPTKTATPAPTSTPTATHTPVGQTLPTATTTPSPTPPTMPSPAATLPPNANSPVDVVIAVETQPNTNEFMAGQEIVFIVTVSNQGAVPASAISLNGTFPTNAPIVELQPGPGFVCPAASNLNTEIIACAIPTGLLGGKSSILNIIVRPTQTGILNYKLNVSTISQESNVANNTIEMSRTIKPVMKVFLPMSVMTRE